MTTERKTIGLSDMKEKQTVSIAAIHAGSVLGRRIRDMGIISGPQLTVYGRTILKDSATIQVIDTPLTLRNNEADYISVQILRN